MWNFLWEILSWLFGGTAKKDDISAQPSQPDVISKEVEKAVKGKDDRAYMTLAMINLLFAIRLHESGKAGYNADYQNDDKYGDLSRFTFDEVRSLGRRQVSRDREASSAIGAYQFLTKTLDSLKASLNLTGKEMFTPEFQDDLAVALMTRRGRVKYMQGEISAEEFANNLAKEWASLPVVTRMRGAHRMVSPGQSYYAGDGLNKAFHKPGDILALVRSLR